MLNFIRQLKDRYLREIENLSKDSPQLRPLRDNLSALRLAEAALLKQQLNLENPGHPLQIAVLGPTQAGKSTLLNFLTGSESAGVSALAGFTVHAQAYTVGVEPDDKRWAEILFDGFAQLQAKQLDPDDYLQYSIDSCNSKPLQNLAPCVLWDTPDFDSVHAYGYNSAVLRTLALADILVLIVSREKYADKSVWDLIQLSAPLDKPLLVCINKLDPGSDQAIVESFQQRFAEHNKDSKIPALIGIPFVRNLDKTASALPSPIRQQIFTELQKLAVNVDRQAQQASVYNFIEKHWEPWIGPVKAEHDAGKQWQDMLQQTLSGAESQYKRDYLNNPENYDSFKRALAQLLILLEIPGVAKTLVKARQAITWPVRKLLSLGSEKLGHSEPQADIEQTVLMNICNNTLTSLLTQLDEQEEKQIELAGWWATLGKKLLENRESINHEFAARVDAYKAEFQQEIDKTAHD
ncbi:MAG: GTPase domain-containing protein, partial [Gammaproteobacteria bacterium]|nr:GTPase domain-containing protein [Gammaproteobacteria bacterium]